MSHLQVSPLARGLYRRGHRDERRQFRSAGSTQGVALLADAEQAGVRFATHLGAHSLAELRAVPAQRIVDAPIDLWRSVPGTASTAGIVDGYVVPADPFSLYTAGEAAPVDLLVGYTSAEGANWASEPVTAAAFRQRLATDFGPFAGRFLKLYPASSDAEATVRTSGWRASARSNGRSQPGPGSIPPLSAATSISTVSRTRRGSARSGASAPAMVPS